MLKPLGGWEHYNFSHSQTAARSTTDLAKCCAHTLQAYAEVPVKTNQFLFSYHIILIKFPMGHVVSFEGHF